MWMEKQIGRAGSGGPLAHVRLYEFLSWALWHYFSLRRRWYLGPKRSLEWLEENRQQLFAIITRALAPGARLNDVKKMAELIHAGRP